MHQTTIFIEMTKNLWQNATLTLDSKGKFLSLRSDDNEDIFNDQQLYACYQEDEQKLFWLWITKDDQTFRIKYDSIFKTTGEAKPYIDSPSLLPRKIPPQLALFNEATYLALRKQAQRCYQNL